uniref:Uncharacterized protein n=1 Tax=Cacopsylla melanoneura TaxID=428564 RepID=A0A8D8ZDT8_9HEMI
MPTYSTYTCFSDSTSFLFFILWLPTPLLYVMSISSVYSMYLYLLVSKVALSFFSSYTLASYATPLLPNFFSFLPDLIHYLQFVLRRCTRPKRRPLKLGDYIIMLLKGGHV